MYLKLIRLFSILAMLLSMVNAVLGQTERKGYEFTVTVTDLQKEPLIGVNVYTEDQSFISVTDLDGKVALQDLAYNEVINFSYVGFAPLKIPFFEIRKLGGIIRLKQQLDALPEIVVIGRRDEKPEEIPYEIGIVTQEKLKRYNSQTTADALMANENVFIQKSQAGGGSINIRGFEANKVLLVVDGVRLNNIVYRNGHLQDAIKVDNNALEQIEVIYGPGSLNYGSDALGGVVQFRTKDPKLLDDDNDSKGYRSNSNVMTRWSSANQEFTINGNVNYGTKKWATFTNFTFANYEDLRAGNNRPAAYPDFGKRLEFVSNEINEIFTNPNPNVQTPTGFAQFDILQKIKYKISNNKYFHVNFQYSTSTDVPRYDFLTETRDGDFRFGDWYYGPQQRIFLSLKYQSFKKNKFFNKMTVIAATQRLDEDRNAQNLNSRLLTFNNEDIYAHSLTADFQRNFNSQLALTYGLDVNYNFLFSTAGQIDFSTGEVSGRATIRYPSAGSDMTLGAGYGNLTYQTKDSLFTVFGGLRYTYARLNALYNPSRPGDAFGLPPFFSQEGFLAVNTRLTWSVGGVFNSKNGWQVKTSASSAFHAPNIDDFAKFRARNGFFSVPNPDLKPERTVNMELTVAKSFGDIKSRNGNGASISLTGYFTRLMDAYRREPFTFQGSDVILDSSTGELYSVQANVNREEGTIRGGSGNFLLKFGKLDAYAGAGYSIGRVIENGEDIGPLDHIPPLFTKGGINYRTKKMKLAYALRYNAWKRIEDYPDGQDNIEHATEDGTYPWMTHNVYATYYINEKFSIDTSLENIFDVHYRPFSSGVSAAGRNLIIAVRGKF